MTKENTSAGIFTAMMQALISQRTFKCNLPSLFPDLLPVDFIEVLLRN
jgi:hypothetical protein